MNVKQTLRKFTEVCSRRFHGSHGSNFRGPQKTAIFSRKLAPGSLFTEVHGSPGSCSANPQKTAVFSRRFTEPEVTPLRGEALAAFPHRELGA